MIRTSIATIAAVLTLAACTPAQEAGDEVEGGNDGAGISGTDVSGGGAPVPSEGDAAVSKAKNALTCDSPAKAGDTGESLIARYGDDAKLATLGGPEGIEMPGVVLWDGDDARRVEIVFDDEARTNISFMRVFGGSDWTLSGVKVGDTLEAARSVNGKPIKFFGFEWDYSGGVFDYDGGTLDDIGECAAQMTLTFDWDNAAATYNDALSGDVEVSSDDPVVDQKAISVVELGIGFPRAE